MSTDHGPQRESIRDLMGRHGLDPNRMQSERDFIDMMQPYAEDLMTTDHGPQRQPARYSSVPEMLDAMGEPEMAEVVHELARLRAENERLTKALENVKLFWDDKHCEYVGPGWCEITVREEYVHKLKLAADALRGDNP